MTPEQMRTTATALADFAARCATELNHQATAAHRQVVAYGENSRELIENAARLFAKEKRAVEASKAAWSAADQARAACVEVPPNPDRTRLHLRALAHCARLAALETMKTPVDALARLRLIFPEP